MAAIDFGSLIDKLDDESDRAALADREQQRTLFSNTLSGPAISRTNAHSS